jgi:hypothetical protein
MLGKLTLLTSQLHPVTDLSLNLLTGFVVVARSLHLGSDDHERTYKTRPLTRFLL